MTSLTHIAYYTRKTINWAILVVIAYIILQMSWGVFKKVYIAIFPPKPIPPNHAFGKLPMLKFPLTASPSGEMTYTLETIEGSVPRASESATVFFMPKNPPNLLALPRAEDFAKRMNFQGKPIQETKYLFRFEDTETPLRKLRYDLVSKNFMLRYLFEEDLGLFQERSIPLPEIAKSEGKSWLQTYGIYEKDITDGLINIRFLKLSQKQLVETTSYSQADAVRLDFFRSHRNGLPVLTPYVGESNISFVFSGSRNEKKRILQFFYTYWPIDAETTGTYALKPSTLAWQELQTGKGYIVRYPKKGSTATIRRVYLAYYDSFDPQTYLQPIFVFEGDEGFLAYVPAIASEWILPE